jgi:hypothetical protein
MWLDRAFASFRYAISFSIGKGGRLPGQSEPVQGFLDPSWTALLVALHGMGIQPVRAVQFIGPVLFGLLLAVCAIEVWRRHHRLLPLLPIGIVAASAPAVAAARSGTDDLWLAVWSVLAVVCAGMDAERCQTRWRTVLALAGLCLTGWFGLLLGTGIAVLGWRAHIRSWAWVVVSVLIAGAVASMAFGFTSSPAILTRLSAFNPAIVLHSLLYVPALIGLGLLGVAATGLGETRTGVMAWGALVWLGYALTGPVDVGALAASLVPLLGLFILLAAEALAGIRRARWVWAAVLVAIIFDIYGSQSAWVEASKSRRVELKQSRDMARFLKWRFGPGTTVAVHTPGSLAYHWGRAVIDMSGTTESASVTPQTVMAMRPEAIMPPSGLVTPQIIRVPMGGGWGKEIYDVYDLHSIQHQRKWGLVGIHPAFFQLYIRNDLPRLAPDISVEEGNRFPKE